MLAVIATIVAAYVIGFIPVAYIAGRLTKGVDLRELGSGNVGASNVWQSVSKSLVVPVGLAQIAQGAAAVVIARAAEQGAGVQMAAAIAAVLANGWNPWLGFAGGRGVGQTIGALLILAPWALATFIAIAVAGVALRAIPQSVAIALAATPIAAAIAGAPATVVAGCATLATIVLLKRLLANGTPSPAYARPGVWLIRLAYDRDIRDREVWVTRGSDGRGAKPSNG